jgi:hypothetical protein
MIKRFANVSTPKTKKTAPAAESSIPKPRRGKEKLIQLDDLIPKGNVSGGRQLLFGATDINQTNNKRKR